MPRLAVTPISGTQEIRNRRAALARRAGNAIAIALIVALLKNVIRHSRANTVTIGFAIEHDAARISVADDGIGFDPNLVGRQSSLVSLRRLLQASGGDLQVDSRPGVGTTAVATVPLLAT